jgi:hypothetical protein
MSKSGPRETSFEDRRQWKLGFLIFREQQIVSGHPAATLPFPEFRNRGAAVAVRFSDGRVIWPTLLAVNTRK